ncbi:class I SAM-dependent methyltransferase [Mycolicibacterium stellerae]|uniref:class I SAM-dependent methyltransferase n=1 Tax=Mycolicibacterium stellerae TaxID=2358193 RepID=UPI0013DE4F43|nr:class I SAM-dependent methyltransferase [Mycolicibacterium stellerae]
MDTLMRQSRRVGSFPYPHQAAFLLDNPVRRLLANPGRLADALELTGTETVLELGPGPGFFSIEVAGRLPSGRLELFDIQPEMLDKARRKLDRFGHRNVGFHSGDAGAGLPFPDDTFDVAFSVSVIGEVPDKAGCLRSLARVVKPGGSLVFLESFPDPDRLSAPELRELAEPAGFSFRDSAGTIWQDIVRFDRFGG